MKSERVTGRTRSAFRHSYWMQLWASLYALGRVHPQPRLTALVAVLVVLLLALIVHTSPITLEGQQ